MVLRLCLKVICSRFVKVIGKVNVKGELAIRLWLKLMVMLAISSTTSSVKAT